MAGWEEATNEQLDYVRALAERVRTVRDVESRGALNRWQASQVIDVLRDALGLDQSNVVSIDHARSTPHFVPPTAVIDHERDACDAYDAHQLTVFRALERVEEDESAWVGGRYIRLPMRYRGRPIVYQRWPHYRPYGRREVRYGYRWVCLWSGHKNPVRGGSPTGWATTLEGAVRHYLKCPGSNDLGE